MGTKKYLVIGIIAFIMAQPLSAQFSLDGQFRTRGFLDHGYMVPAQQNTNINYVTDQRSRLIFNYQTDNYTTRLTLQDARIWGSDDLSNPTGTEGNSYALGIYEAWVQLPLSERFQLKIGRQEWNYNDIRIISNRNWWTSGLSYDGALLQYGNKGEGIFFDLGLSYNNHGNRIGLYNNSSWPGEKLKTLNFINVKKHLGQQSSLSLLLTLSGREDINTNVVPAKGTHGMQILYNKKRNINNGLFADISGYYQHGKDLSRDTDGNFKEVSAYMFAGEIGFRTFSRKLEISAQAELFSGKDYKKTNKSYLDTRHTFDLLYGGRFPFYGGYLNHFILQESYLKGTKSGGYLSPSLNIRYKLNQKNILGLSWYNPMLTTNVTAHTTIDPATNKPAGTETSNNGDKVYWKGSLGHYLDMNFTHKINKELIVKAGFSYGWISDIKNQMVYGYKDPANKTLYEPGDNYTGWIMLVVKPHFFNE